MIEARGAPPMAASAANALTTMMRGKHTPNPVSAKAPSFGMCPMYMRSTMLYRTLTTCAVMAGTARRNNSGPSASDPRSTGLRAR